MKSLFATHLNVTISNWDDTSVTIWGTGDSTISSTINWDFTVTWYERLQVLHKSDGSDTWSTSTMRNGEGLMKVKMTDISTD